MSQKANSQVKFLRRRVLGEELPHIDDKEAAPRGNKNDEVEHQTCGVVKLREQDIGNNPTLGLQLQQLPRLQ